VRSSARGIQPTSAIAEGKPEIQQKRMHHRNKEKRRYQLNWIKLKDTLGFSRLACHICQTAPDLPVAAAAVQSTSSREMLSTLGYKARTEAHKTRDH